MPDIKDWQSQNTVFEKLAAYGYNRYDLPQALGGESVRAAMVSPEFFSMLGVKPLLGRELGPSDDRERVAVLGYELWQQAFNGTPHVIGRTLRLRDHDFTIVGVMPRSFRLPTPEVALWLSFADLYAMSGNPSVGNWFTDRGLRGWRVIGRLKDAVSLAQAQAQMSGIETRLGQTFPGDKGLAISLVPLRTQVVGGIEHALLLFLGAVGFVLLIACANVANLQLAKATTRQREMAVRQALGGTARRLLQLMLTESILLGAIGGLFGVALAFWGVRIFLRLVPQSIPRLQDIRVDATVLLFALGISFLASMLFGLAPALRMRSLHLNDSLRDGGRTAGDHSHGRRMRALLVSGEIALATVLVASAGLTLRSFVNLILLNPGFSPEHLLTFDVMASLDRYPQPWQQIKFFDQVLDRIRVLPDVQAAGACTSMPPEISQEADTLTIPGRTPEDPDKKPVAWYLPATPGFLDTLGIPLLEGRDFSDADNANSPSAAIINQQIAEKYFAHGDPLGQKISFRGADRTIIGVAGNTTYSGLGAPADFQIYVPYAQGTFPGLHFAVRTTGDPMNVVHAVSSAVSSVDAQAQAMRIATMEQLLFRSIVQPRFYTWLLAIFGFVALALSAMGIFGVISYSVSRQTHELGVRMALGAARQDVMRLVLGQGLKLTLAGVVLGVGGALALTRLLSNLLYGVQPFDPITFIAVSLLLIGVALFACYFPARRAARVDPMVALRYE
jgi:putative ABC transport system permease protein